MAAPEDTEDIEDWYDHPNRRDVASLQFLSDVEGGLVGWRLEAIGNHYRSFDETADESSDFEAASDTAATWEFVFSIDSYAGPMVLWSDVVDGTDSAVIERLANWFDSIKRDGAFQVNDQLWTLHGDTWVVSTPEGRH